jgi:hypothetical protein
VPVRNIWYALQAGSVIAARASRDTPEAANRETGAHMALETTPANGPLPGYLNFC